ncbi:acyl-CoA dehydrogenase family protein, partial [Streptomyces sp. NPDC091278]|uniref:acyl-CoA dehydrogenase family protein n=1 Tax=Streptomyces sp. NPDC091278 TaxID=3155301 RepID=UPI00344DD6D2
RPVPQGLHSLPARLPAPGDVGPGEQRRPPAAGSGLTVDGELAAAKVAAGEAGYAAARTALQIHGAIGYTEELDLSLWLRKARPLRDAWGDPASCRAAVLDAYRGTGT